MQNYSARHTTDKAAHVTASNTKCVARVTQFNKQKQCLQPITHFQANHYL